MITVRQLKEVLSQLPSECDLYEIKLTGPVLGLDANIPGWEMSIQSIKGDGSKVYLESGHAEVFDPSV